MNYFTRVRVFVAAASIAAAVCVFSPLLPAQPSTRATLEGRVFDQVTGRYLENARVTIVETGAEQLTDSSGRYRFIGVPPGAATVKAFYTGLDSLTAKVTVTPGQTAVHDFNYAGGSGTAGETVQLGAFVVSVARETDGAALAINEQRVAPNIKNVVSTTEFGENTDGDIEQFVKFIPGVAAGEGGFRIRGFSDTLTTVNIDGNRVANAINSTESRTVGLEQLMLNNVSRIEVTKVPTPDQPADAMSGSVNLISKSAFERKKPEFAYRTFLQWRGGEAFKLSEQPAMMGRRRLTTPGADLNWLVPVNDRLGFTVTLTTVESSSPAPFISMDWVPTSGVASAAVTSAPVENPYLKLYTVRDQPRIIKRVSAGFTTDFRLTPNDVLSLGFTYTKRDLNGVFQGFNADLGNGVLPGWTRSNVQGAAAAGSITLGTTANMTHGESYQPNLLYRHNGRVWRLEARAAYSHSKENIPPAAKSGEFNSVNVSLPRVTLAYSNIEERHAVVTARDAAGNPLNFYNLNNYTISSVTEATRQSTDLIRSASANATRDFNFGVPLTLKAGVDFREQTRDINRWSWGYNFVGADRRAGTADDNAAVLLDEIYSQRNSPWRFPQKQQWASPSKAYQLFVAHPEYFSITNALSPWQTYVRASKWLQESITSGYLRADLRLFKNRLWLVGGARYEHTKDDGIGPLQDPTLVPKGTTDPNLINQYTYKLRGSHSLVTYGALYPSLNASWSFTDNLILRAAYARTLTRPDLSSILPGATLPDPSGTGRTITLTNTTLRPWESNNSDLNLEYYFARIGSVSVGVFHKDITDFIGSVTVPATADLLEPYDIEPSIYGDQNGYLVSTQKNVGSGTMNGLELGYKQTLGFIPDRLGAVQVFGTYTQMRMGGRAASYLLNTFTPHMFSYGLAWTFKRFTMQANVASVGKHRYGAFTGTGVPANSIADNFQPRIYNLSAGLVINRHLQLFYSVRDVHGDFFYQRRYSDNTPNYARFRSWTQTPALHSLGLKGTF
ncbi:MAG: TonB-dependent receptor [Verrucomicrobia bacterium]|nr:TonB-dependent receptor [Verrucomicrobiota bacterium]